MKRILIILLVTMTVAGLRAQAPKAQEKFSPEQFEASLQETITNDAHLTPDEAAKFFPVYKEMMAKQREIFEKQRQMSTNKPQDEAGCAKVIKDCDAYDLELKRLQQTYHNRFLELLPASKVYDILKAENRFHRHMMKSFGRSHNKQTNRREAGQNTNAHQRPSRQNQ